MNFRLDPSYRYTRTKFRVGRDFNHFSFDDQRISFLRTYFDKENYSSMLSLIDCMFDEFGFLLAGKGLNATQITFVLNRLKEIKLRILPLLELDPSARKAKKVPLRSIQNLNALNEYLDAHAGAF